LTELLRRSANGNYSAVNIAAQNITSWGLVVNDRGSVAGFYQNSSSKYHGFLSKPQPLKHARREGRLAPPFLADIITNEVAPVFALVEVREFPAADQ
jgi:hypothetical protein